MVSASDFDNTREKLPYLNEKQGNYLLEINKTEITDSEDYFFAELTVLEADGPDAYEPGDTVKHAIKLDVSKKATARMVERVRNLIYSATGAKKLSGGDTMAMLHDGAALSGKKLRSRVEPEKDDDGEVSLKDDGTPWVSVRFQQA